MSSKLENVGAVLAGLFMLAWFGLIGATIIRVLWLGFAWVWGL